MAASHGGQVPLSLEEVCEVVEKLCAAGVPPDSDPSDAESLRETARQLLALGDRLAEAQQRRRAQGERREGRRDGSLSSAPSEEPLCWADAAAPRRACCGRDAAAAALVVLLTLPYFRCVFYSRWFIDEGFAIYRNPDARGETPLTELLRHDFWGTPLVPPEGHNTHKSFRPLITLMYAAEWQLCARYGFQGAEMKPMRLLSCLIHSANAGITFWLLRRLRVRRPWALLGASLFATHPVHIENIVYLVGRADSLSTTFVMLAVLVYLHSTLGRFTSWSWWSHPLLIALTVAAGLCKEPGFTALFFLACAEIILRGRWRHVFILVSSFMALGAARTWYVGGSDAGFGYVDTPVRYQDARITRALTYLYQHAYYAKLLVLPWNQSWDYSYDALPMLHSLEDARVLAVLSAYLAVVAFAAHGLRICRAMPAPVLGLGLVVVPFVPASNLFFLVGTTVGERLLYPCTVGWALMVASQGSRCTSKGRGRPAWITAGVLLVVYAWNSNVRMGHWRSPAELFETDALHWDRSVKVLHHKAAELQRRGDLHGALDFYIRSLAVFDDQAITDYCIARILINLDRLNEAYARFEKILGGHGIGFHDGNDFLWMTDLGYLLVRLGEYSQGERYLVDGLQRFPYNCYGWNALGVAQAHQGRLEESVQTLTQSLQCNAESPGTWSNLAVVYAYGGAAQQALEALQNAASLNATHAAVVHNALVLQGDASAAGAQPMFDLYIPPPAS